MMQFNTTHGYSSAVFAALILALGGCATSPTQQTNGLGGSAGDPFGGVTGQAGSDALGGAGSFAGAAGDSAAVGSAGVTGGFAGTGADAGGIAGFGGELGGAGGSGAAGMGAGGSGAAGTGGLAVMPPCTSKPSQVVVLGDSYINWGTHTFPQDLAKEAGETYRMYAVGGYSMGSGGIGLIPPEFDQAVAADPDIKAVVMDGGGNDILIPAATWAGGGDCKNNAMSPTLQVCRDIVKTAFDAASKLMDTAAAKGVSDVVYFFYPHVPEGTAIGGAHPNAILDYALPMAKDLCDGAVMRTGGKLRCHFVDLVPVFTGHPDWFAAGDIHENPTGSAAIAHAVWQTMKDNCVAQPASSGCCKP